MKYNLFIAHWLFVIIVLFLTSCQSPREHKFVIGVSQCAGGEWRDMQNEEMRVESTFYDDVSVEFRCANDQDSLQIEDIQYFIDKRVDMLIISPNTYQALVPVISKAYKAGIPIVLFDRRIDSNDYTAFVGASNKHIGEQVGQYIGSILKGEGHVVEIKYNMKSAPFRERHEGFVQAIKEFPNIQTHSIPVGNTDSDTRIMIDSILEQQPIPDAIFSQIDIGLYSVFESIESHGLHDRIKTVGIDGMPFKNMGIDQVLSGKQSATFVYPAGGDRIMQVAMNVLLNKSFNKENELSSYVIDSINVRSSRLQNDMALEQYKKINRLYQQSDRYFTQIAQSKMYLVGLILIAVLLGVLVFVLYRAYWMRNKLNHQLMKQNELISKQKDEMMEQRDQLIEMSKHLEEATQAKLLFFTNVSHDFRTPLTLITGPLAQLKEHANWKESELRLYEIIQRNVQVLLRLVNQIIDFRKFENGKMKLSLSSFSISEKVNDWSQAFIALAEEKNINFELNIQSDEFKIDGDEEKLERVFFNIVYNAFKFTPEHGRICVELKTCPNSEEDSLEMDITDNGIGMAEQYVNHIFDRFYKVNSQDHGSGIGLNLAKAFVELHGGSIDVKSEVNLGTTFKIILPFVQKKVNTEIQTTSSSQNEHDIVETANSTSVSKLIFELKESIDEESIDKEIVLVIDDNDDIRDYLKYILSDKYKVVQAKDGKEGLFEACRVIPDVIICDVMMPVMDGLEFCKAVKSDVLTSHIPVLLLTACTLDEQRVSGYESGADSYISKPFTAELLLSRVSNLIKNRKRFKPNVLPLKIQSSEVDDLDEKFVRQFHKLLDENLNNSSLSMQWLSDQIGMSRTQLYRKIKALIGTSPSDIIRESRLKKAEILLKTPGMSVADVAYSTGFSSPSYFTKCYKEFFGKLPKETNKG